MKKLLITVWNWIKCNILNDHEWTYAHKQGIKPDLTDATPENIVDKFYEYSKMWCEHCGKASKYNRA